MKVYIVYGWVPYEGNEVLGVFESEFEGKKLISKLESENYVPLNGIPYEEYLIEEVEMNVLINRD